MDIPGLFKHVQHAENIAIIRLEFTSSNYNQGRPGFLGIRYTGAF